MTANGFAFSMPLGKWYLRIERAISSNRLLASPKTFEIRYIKGKGYYNVHQYDKCSKLFLDAFVQKW